MELLRGLWVGFGVGIFCFPEGCGVREPRIHKSHRPATLPIYPICGLFGVLGLQIRFFFFFFFGGGGLGLKVWVTL